MSAPAAAKHDFLELPDLAAEKLGGSVLWATDDYFAEKENLLKPHEAEWREQLSPAEYAVLREALDTGGVWSIARGLARNVDDYKRHLAACDLPRRNDLDGRGTLSEEALAAFTKFFLQICIDQVKFMEELVQPDRLRSRILLWAEEEIRIDALPPKAGNVLEAVLYAFSQTASFAEGLEKCCSFRGRKDVIASAYGALAGAYYGLRGIPESWRAELCKRELIEGLASRLAADTP